MLIQIWIVLGVGNVIAFGLNISARTWWALPINVLAVVFCSINVYQDTRTKSK